MDEHLHAIDDALVRMRRLWTATPRGPDMSSILVAEACARGPAPVTVADVARFAGVEHSTASRLVERAVQAGYVERAPRGRQVRLLLTAAGTELRNLAVTARTTWLRDMVHDWPDADVQTFTRLLTAFAGRVVERGGPAAPGGPTGR